MAKKPNFRGMVQARIITARDELKRTDANPMLISYLNETVSLVEKI